MNKPKDAALLIHYYFPPIHSIGVIRNYHLACEFEKKFSTVKVLTTSNRNILRSSDMYDHEKFSITELRTLDYRSRSKSKSHMSEEKKKSIFFKYGKKVMDSYPFNLWVGEGGSRYIKEGIDQGTKFLTDHPTALIYSSFRPFADLYIGYILKRKFPEANWVLDFRDLPVDPLYQNVLFPKQQKRKIRKIIREADLVTTVSKGLKDMLDELHPNVLDVYNGIQIAENLPERFEKFTLCYTGSMFGDKRDPSAFLQWLSSLLKDKIVDENNIHIIYAGKDSQTFANYVHKFGLSNIFKDKGIISQKESVVLQRKSHVNLLFTSVYKNYKGILTGKLFEYLGSLSPTLAIINGGKDQEFEDIFSNTNAGSTFYSTDTENKEFLEWYNQWQANIPYRCDIEKLKNTFSWELAANKILKEIS